MQHKKKKISSCSKEENRGLSQLSDVSKPPKKRKHKFDDETENIAVTPEKTKTFNLDPDLFTCETTPVKTPPTKEIQCEKVNTADIPNRSVKNKPTTSKKSLFQCNIESVENVEDSSDEKGENKENDDPEKKNISEKQGKNLHDRGAVDNELLKTKENETVVPEDSSNKLKKKKNIDKSAADMNAKDQLKVKSDTEKKPKKRSKKEKSASINNDNAQTVPESSVKTKSKEKKSKTPKSEKKCKDNGTAKEKPTLKKGSKEKTDTAIVKKDKVKFALPTLSTSTTPKPTEVGDHVVTNEQKEKIDTNKIPVKPSFINKNANNGTDKNILKKKKKGGFMAPSVAPRSNSSSQETPQVTHKADKSVKDTQPTENPTDINVKQNTDEQTVPGMEAASDIYTETDHEMNLPVQEENKYANTTTDPFTSALNYPEASYTQNPFSSALHHHAEVPSESSGNPFSSALDHPLSSAATNPFASARSHPLAASGGYDIDHFDAIEE